MFSTRARFRARHSSSSSISLSSQSFSSQSFSSASYSSQSFSSVSMSSNSSSNSSQSFSSASYSSQSFSSQSFSSGSPFPGDGWYCLQFQRWDSADCSGNGVFNPLYGILVVEYIANEAAWESYHFGECVLDETYEPSFSYMYLYRSGPYDTPEECGCVGWVCIEIKMGLTCDNLTTVAHNCLDVFCSTSGYPYFDCTYPYQPGDSECHDWMGQKRIIITHPGLYTDSDCGDECAD